MRKLHLAAIGDNCIDRYLSLGLARVGGNALNVAVHFAKAGHCASYFGAVGDDADGRWTRTILVENGVDARHLEVRPELTAFTEIEHNDHGDRKFLFEEFGASGAYHPSWESQNELQTLDHIHFGLLSGAEGVCASLKEGRATLSIDCAVNAARVPMDVAFGSVGEDEVAAQGELERLLSAGHSIVVVTRGAKGAIAASGAQRWRITGQKITVKDTTGAGDTFIAWFLVVWKETGDIQRALGKATQEAASTCGHLGGFIQDDYVLINR